MQTPGSISLQPGERVLVESQKISKNSRVFRIFLNSFLWWAGMNAVYLLVWIVTIAYMLIRGDSNFLSFGLGYAIMGYYYFFAYLFLITPIYHLISGLRAAGDHLTVTNQRVFGSSRSRWVVLSMENVQAITPFFINKYTERSMWSHAIPYQQAVVSTRPDVKGKQRAFKFWIEDVHGFISRYYDPNTWKVN
jgi:hypothetical protein